MQMYEYNFLIPILQNGTKEPHPVEAWEWLQDQLTEAMCGLTYENSTCTGVWNDSNRLVWDTSYRYSVDIEHGKLEILKSILTEACNKFGQECIRLAGGPNTEVVYIDSTHSEPAPTLLDWVMGQLAVIEETRLRPVLKGSREAAIIIELKDRCTHEGLLDFALTLPELSTKTPRDCRIQLLRCLEKLGVAEVMC